MKNQALFSSKDKSKELKRRLLQFLLGALRVKIRLHLRGPSAHVSAIANFKGSTTHTLVLKLNE